MFKQHREKEHAELQEALLTQTNLTFQKEYSSAPYTSLLVAVVLQHIYTSVCNVGPLINYTLPSLIIATELSILLQLKGSFFEIFSLSPIAEFVKLSRGWTMELTSHLTLTSCDI